MSQPYYVPEKVSAENQVDALTRQLLRDKLEALAPTSRARFDEIWRHRFPDGDIVAQMSTRLLHQSIGLVDRTLEAAQRAQLSENDG